jgi:DNA polymerase-3 subunit gamma/tau
VPAVAEPKSAPPAEPARAVEPAQPDDALLPAAGSSPADSLRQNWNAVLDAVKQESRVAWALLSNASVLSLESGILTLQFLREGEMKRFSVSGHDAVLKRVLSTGFGLNVMVKGVIGAGQDPGVTRAAGSADPGPDHASRPAAAAQAGAPRYHDEPPPDDEMQAEDPDEPADDHAPGVTELTGMDLIQRELGGQVISDTED